ncbi:hypothetical protein DXB85_19215 [Parabacteroides merdae]|nr:hypothetical protein DXB85_19215 [Parabacteroides merdae]
MTVDWMGVLVGVLSLLVASLAVFFAVSYLTVEKRIRSAFELKMKESFEDFETKTVKGIISEQHKIIDMLRDYFLAKKDLSSYVTSLIYSLDMAVRVNQQDTIDLVIGCLIDVYSEVNVAKTLNIKQHNIDKLFLLLDDLSGRNTHILLSKLEFVYDRPCGDTPKT